MRGLFRDGGGYGWRGRPSGGGGSWNTDRVRTVIKKYNSSMLQDRELNF